MLPAGMFFVSLITVSLATNTVGNGDEKCQPCSIVECPPLPTECGSEPVLDKCGCCMTCDKVLRPVLRLLLPLHEDKESTIGIKTDTKDNSVKPIGRHDYSDPFQFFFEPLSGGNDAPVFTDVNIHVFPLNINDQKVNPIQQGSKLMSAPFSNSPGFSLLNKILGIFGERRSATTTPWPTCGLYDNLTTAPVRDVKVTTERPKINFRSFANPGTEIEGLGKAQRTEESSHKPDVNDNFEDTISITRLKFVPLRLFFPNVGNIHGDMTNSGRKDFREFTGNPNIRIIDFSPYKTISDNENIKPKTMPQRQNGDKLEDEGLASFMRSKFHNTFENILRMISGQLKRKTGVRVHKGYTENSEFNKSDNKEPPIINNNEGFINNGGMSRKSAGDTVEMPLLKFNYLPIKFPDSNTGKNHMIFDEVKPTTKRQKLEEVFVDTSGFGMKQLQENFVDSNDNKLTTKASKDAITIEENTTVRNKRLISGNEARDQFTAVSQGTTPKIVVKDIEEKMALKKKATYVFSDSNKNIIPSMRVFQRQNDLGERGTMQFEKKPKIADDMIREEINKYLEMASKAQEMRAQIKAMADEQNKKWGNVVNQYINKPLQNRFFGAAHGASLPGGKRHSDLEMLFTAADQSAFGNHKYPDVNESVSGFQSKGDHDRALKTTEDIFEEAEKGIGKLKEITNPLKADNIGTSNVATSHTSEASADDGYNRELDERTRQLSNEMNSKTGRMVKKLKKSPAKTLVKVMEAFREYFDNINQDPGVVNIGQDVLSKEMKMSTTVSQPPIIK